MTTSTDTSRMIYETPAEEFLLTMISVNERSAFTSHSDRSVEILICLKGKAVITDLENGEIFPMAPGKSVIIPSQIPRYRIEGKAKLYMASVPL